MNNYSFVDYKIWQAVAGNNCFEIEPFKEANRDIFVCV